VNSFGSAALKEDMEAGDAAQSEISESSASRRYQKGRRLQTGDSVEEIEEDNIP